MLQICAFYGPSNKLKRRKNKKKKLQKIQSRVTIGGLSSL